MRSMITLVLVLASGCATCPPTETVVESPCEAVRPAYDDARARINTGTAAQCADGFESFGCGFFTEPTAAQIENCEEMLSAAQSCAALQNALYACEGGT